MISVVIPLYNKENQIKRAIRSVIVQSYTDWECVVIDDGSFDSSAKNVKEFDDSRIKYFYQENGGVASARNRGVKCAVGDWIVFLDADDYLLPNALSILSNTVKKGNTVFGAANFYRSSENPNNLYTDISSQMIDNPFKMWYCGKFCPRTGAAIYKRDVLMQFPFDESLARYEDAQSLFEIMRCYKFFYENVPVMVYTDDCKGLSHLCSNPQKDFIFHMNFNKKSFWEKMVFSKLFWEGVRGYKKHRFYLFRLYFPYLWIILFERFYKLI